MMDISYSAHMASVRTGIHDKVSFLGYIYLLLPGFCGDGSLECQSRAEGSPTACDNSGTYFNTFIVRRMRSKSDTAFNSRRSGC